MILKVILFLVNMRQQEYFGSLNHMQLQRCRCNYSAAAFVVSMCGFVNLTLQPKFVSTSLSI